MIDVVVNKEQSTNFEIKVINFLTEDKILKSAANGQHFRKPKNTNYMPNILRKRVENMENYICISGVKIEIPSLLIETIAIATQKKESVSKPANPLEALQHAVRSGQAQEKYKVHDVISVGGYDLEIIGFNHDKASDNPKAPTVTLMAKTLLDRHVWHDGACEEGWVGTDLRQWLHDEIYENLPSEIGKFVTPVNKITHNYKGYIVNTVDYLFIPSESELFGSANWSDYEDGTRYEAFATRHDRILKDKDGNEDWYWTRSAWGGSSTYATNVCSNGSAFYHSTSNIGIRVPLCFTIS